MILFNEARPATLREASRIRKEVGRRLSDLRLSEDVSSALLVSLSEILANIVTHSDPAAGFIGVRVDLIGAQLRLETTDDGGPFSDFVAEVVNAITVVEDTFCESGRGLRLIGQCLERLSYESGPVNRCVGWRRLSTAKPVVLIVEDDETLLDLYAHYLRDLNVLKARSCVEALAVIRELEVTVIVADLHLGDGLATSLLHMTEGDLEELAPIVLVSGTEDINAPREALSRGVELFIAKPVSGPQLRGSIDIAITRSASRTARIARSFARNVDGLLVAKVPSFLCGHDVVVARSSASAGGGDLIFDQVLHMRRRIVLLDVMGHGVSAKAWAIAYAALCRGLCHARPLDNCAEFMQKLAEIAWREQAMDSVVATALAIDVFEDGLIEIASAGHPAPMIVKDAGAVQVVVDGSLLGVIAPEPYELASVRLQHGERLVLVTDGVDAGDVAAGGVLPDWLICACGNPDLFVSRGRELGQIATLKLGAQPKDDWTVVVLGASSQVDQA